ncbi:MAG: hypothetical protein IKM34_06275 [Clostridia bacterium]|nr:hypothetical protein [Clostridia bacterium]
MKKLIIVMVVALLALALVACGGDAPTTTKGVDTTAAKPGVDTTAAKPGDDTTAAKPGVITTAKPGDNTTAKPGDDTTAKPGDDTTPVLPGVEGIDILNGTEEDRAINPAGLTGDMNVGAFENHHASLDMNWAYVILFQECENAWYTELVMTVPSDEEGGEDTWVMNEDYKWILTLEGEDHVIERFSVYHVTTYGYVRLDLGPDFELKAKDEDGKVRYAEIKLRIVDVTKDNEPVVFYAYMTDPEWNGVHEFVPPKPTELDPDPNRDPAEVEITGATAISGPEGYTGEHYTNLFDRTDDDQINVQTKLCDSGEVPTPIVWKYDEAKYVTSYSLVGAGDDQTYPSRIPTVFKFYGSNDGNNWTLIDEKNGEAATEGSNYAERNFKLAKGVEYSYFKLELDVTSTYQMSGIMLWTKE